MYTHKNNRYLWATIVEYQLCCLFLKNYLDSLFGSDPIPIRDYKSRIRFK